VILPSILNVDTIRRNRKSKQKGKEVSTNLDIPRGGGNHTTKEKKIKGESKGGSEMREEKRSPRVHHPPKQERGERGAEEKETRRKGTPGNCKKRKRADEKKSGKYGGVARQGRG